jgi:hypothetical protein
VLPLIEQQLQPLQVRPHWGKLFTLPRDYVASCYEKLPEFQNLLSLYDPAGKFRNAFLDHYIFAAAGSQAPQYYWTMWVWHAKPLQKRGIKSGPLRARCLIIVSGL